MMPVEKKRLLSLSEDHEVAVYDIPGSRQYVVLTSHQEYLFTNSHEAYRFAQDIVRKRRSLQPVSRKPIPAPLLSE